MGQIKLRALAALLLAVGAAAAQPSKPPADDPKGLEALWNDLASTEDAKASRALLGLAGQPKESVAFIKERLKPVKPDADLFKKLVAQLDDKKFTARDAASKQLAQEVEYLGKYAKPVLDECLKGEVSAEQKKRLQELVQMVPVDPKDQPKEKTPLKLKGRGVSIQSNNGEITIFIDGKPIDLEALAKPYVPPPVNTQWLRATRAVALLESLGTPEAKAVLKAVAAGEGDAAPTKEAKEALERLDKK